MTASEIGKLGWVGWLRQRKAIVAEIGTIEARLREAQAPVRHLEAELEKANGRWEKAEYERSVAENALKAVQSSLNKAQDALSAAEGRVDRVQGFLSDSERKNASMATRLEDAAKATDEAKAELTALRDKYETLVARRDTPQEAEVKQLKLEVADLSKRLTAERLAHSKANKNLMKLWNFIALRNKPMDVTALNKLVKDLPKLPTEKPRHD